VTCATQAMPRIVRPASRAALAAAMLLAPFAATGPVQASMTLMGASAAGPVSTTTTSGASETTVRDPASRPAPPDDELREVVIVAPEPRYVAPTRRDRIGRIWAPVMINDKGPFRLVLDTGASHSAIIEPVADALGIDLVHAPKALLRGVTGKAVVPLVQAQTLTVGDLELSKVKLPIVINALGGAQGVLGTEGFDDKRVLIDFRNDLIQIRRSQLQPAAAGMVVVPFRREKGLLIVDALVGGVRTRAIVDTGGQASIGNNALRDVLLRQRKQQVVSDDVIVGATDDAQAGQGYPAPLIELGEIRVQGAHITFGDMNIFEHWGITRQPAIMIGMDTLGLLDTLIIDYRLKELHLRLAPKSRS
jgi:predicted aspartyl protease